MHLIHANHRVFWSQSASQDTVEPLFPHLDALCEEPLGGTPLQTRFLNVLAGDFFSVITALIPKNLDAESEFSVANQITRPTVSEYLLCNKVDSASTDGGWS